MRKGKLLKALVMCACLFVVPLTANAEGTCADGAEHKFTDYKPYKEATCTSDATEIAYCDYGCGAESILPIDGTMVEHKFTEYKPHKEATCASDATEIAYCDYGCGAESVLPIDGTMVEHKFTKYEPYEDATYEKDATEIAYCDYGCGAESVLPIDGTMLVKDASSVASDAESPQTGDTTGVLGWAFVMCASMAAVVVVKRRA